MKKQFIVSSGTKVPGPDTRETPRCVNELLMTALDTCAHFSPSEPHALLRHTGQVRCSGPLRLNQERCLVPGQGCVGTSAPLCRLGSEWLVTFNTCHISPEIKKERTQFLIRGNTQKAENVSKRNVCKTSVGIRDRPPQKTSLKGTHFVRWKLGCAKLKNYPPDLHSPTTGKRHSLA